MTTWRYLPQTDDEIKRMLQVCGVHSIEDLLAHIPKDCRPALTETGVPASWEGAVNGPLDEGALRRKMSALAERTSADAVSFLGAGWCPHDIPSAVRQLILRSEFYTAYTPYQAEIAQGTLQAMFEFQTIICELTGCEVSNASLYNGATATAEAALMAMRVTGRNRVLMHRALHPNYREVVKTTLSRIATVDTTAFSLQTGTTDLKALDEALRSETACVIVQNPNFFGCIEDLRELAAATHKAGALLVVVVTEPLALGLLKSPAELGADVVVGEGSSLALGPNYGGPGVGFFGTSSKHLRSLPGRLCGETVDNQGRRGYVLTLTTREQHIRRQKATSNVCTNQSLIALAFGITVSLLGRKGFRELAQLNLEKMAFLNSRLAERKIRSPFSGACFNERVFGPLKNPAPGVHEELLRQKFLAGLPLGEFFPDIPEMSRSLLLCATEQHSKSQIEALAAALGKVNR